MRAEEFAAFVVKRGLLRFNRLSGKPQDAWTDDPILREYRFCNIRREDDRVTAWIRENWREPNENAPDLWFAMLVARILNVPETLAALRVPLTEKSWDPVEMLNTLHYRQDHGYNIFNGAYLVSTSGMVMRKADYVVNYVFQPAWEVREEIRPRKGDTLEAFAARLVTLRGMKGFMAGQVIADVKYHGILKKAPDWATWAICGPGSRRGLNRVMGRPLEKSWKEPEWLRTLGELRAAVNPTIVKELAYGLHAQDFQNCLCEFDKYERARLGEGRPKQKFTPHGDLNQ